MKPRLTVAIAFHDEAAHLGAAVRSILAQTERRFELLLLDDGSADRSLEVARAFLADSRVRLFADGQRRYLAARLNEALRHARGELFARMDADDVSHPRRFERQLARLDENDSVDAVGSQAVLVDEHEIPFGVLEPHSRSDPRHLLLRGLIPHATMLARTRWLRSWGYDESLTRAEDRDLWCRSGPTSHVAVVEEPLYVIRVLTGSESFLGDYRKGQADLRRVIRRYGPSATGPVTTARLLVSSLLKGELMRVAHHAGLAGRLVRRRGRPPNARDENLAREALAAAASHSP